MPLKKKKKQNKVRQSQNKMKIILLGFLLICGCCRAQNEYLYQALEKNLIFYNLVKIYKSGDLIDSNGLAKKYRLWLRWPDLIPDADFRLKLQENAIDQIYPDSSIQLVAFYRHLYDYYNVNSHATYMFGVDDGDEFGDHLYLLAYSKAKPTDIKFISGHIFKDNIWSDFQGKGFEIDNIITYLKLKCYNMDIDSIRYILKSKRYYYFDVMAPKTKYQKHYTVVFDSKDPEVIYLKVKGKLEKW